MAETFALEFLSIIIIIPALGGMSLYGVVTALKWYFKD